MINKVIQNFMTHAFEREGISQVSQEMMEKIATDITWKIDNYKFPIDKKECAKCLGVSLPTLDKYIKEEDIPYRIKNPNSKIRKHYIFFIDEVLEWQKSRLSDLPNRHCYSNLGGLNRRSR